jgi:hypothetical protein
MANTRQNMQESLYVQITCNILHTVCAFVAICNSLQSIRVFADQLWTAVRSIRPAFLSSSKHLLPPRTVVSVYFSTRSYFHSFPLLCLLCFKFGVYIVQQNIIVFLTDVLVRHGHIVHYMSLLFHGNSGCANASTLCQYIHCLSSYILVSLEIKSWRMDVVPSTVALNTVLVNDIMRYLQLNTVLVNNVMRYLQFTLPIMKHLHFVIYSFRFLFQVFAVVK